ncbi:MAG: fibro-slime domain-containing protein [Eubacteriales bacterium]|nr:fibro-slime domain-containing protein [Eubacteriales bacterium]
MKNGRRLLAFVLALAMILTGAPGTAGVVRAEAAAPDRISLEIGETYVVEAYTNADTPVSSNTEIATAAIDWSNDGKVVVTALEAGETTVTFGHNGNNYAIAVTVNGGDSDEVPPAEEETNVGTTDIPDDGDVQGTAGETENGEGLEEPDLYELTLSEEEIWLQQGASCIVSGVTNESGGWLLYQLEGGAADSYNGYVRINGQWGIVIPSGTSIQIAATGDAPVGDVRIQVQISNGGGWTALEGSPTKYITVHVVEPVEEPSVSLNPKSLSFAHGETKSIAAVTANLPDNAVIRWSVYPEELVEISQDENDAETITLTAGQTDGGAVLSAEVVDRTTGDAVKDSTGKAVLATANLYISETEIHDGKKWVLDTSGQLEENGRYAFAAPDQDYVLIDDSNQMGTEAIATEYDGTIAAITNEQAIWTYARRIFTGNAHTLDTLSGISNLNNVQLDAENGKIMIGSSGSGEYIHFDGTAFTKAAGVWNPDIASYGLRLYKEVDAQAELSAEFYITDNIDLEAGDERVIYVGRTGAPEETGVPVAYDGWFAPENIADEQGAPSGSQLEGLTLVKVTVGGVSYTGDELENLKLIPGKDEEIKYYYLSSAFQVKAQFYLVTADGLITSDKIFKEPESGTPGTVEDGITLVGECVLELDRTGEANLLNDPVNTFGLTEEMASTADDYKKLTNAVACELVDVRSGRLISPVNAPGMQRPWTYASSRTDACNYMSNESGWEFSVDAENAPQNLEEGVLTAADLDNSGIIKFIYLAAERVNIEYYYLERENNGREKATLLGTSYTRKDASYKIYPPVFNGQTITEGDAVNQITLTDPWPSGVPERTALVNKAMRLYDENDKLIKEISSVATELQLIQNSDANDPLPGSMFTLKIYYVRPAERTENAIQLPVTFRDFKGDGVLFEFELGGASRAYNLYGVEGADHPNGAGTERTTGLLKDSLENGKPVYQDRTVAYVAGLINSGNYEPYHFSECYTNITDKVFTAGHAALGSMDSVNAALADDGEVTFEEITDAYTGAYYMLSHIWADDGTDDASKDYNVRVPEVHTLRLQEYSDGVDTFYEYNANTYETVVEGGVVKNTETPVSEPPAANAYFHPIDGLGYGNVCQEYSNSMNFLFTTVGEGKFVYNEGKNLYFDFSGDDDVYLFINGKLALDDGGAHAMESASVNLNEVKDSLGLQEGGIYDFTFFHAERRSTGSNFKIRTNIEVTAPSMVTQKLAYQDGERKQNGAVVEAGEPVNYEFILNNDGTEHMFNLSFNDESLGVRMYPKGAKANCKLDGVADARTVSLGHAEAVGEIIANPISAGDVTVTIFENGENGDEYPAIQNYKFEWDEENATYWPELNGTEFIEDEAIKEGTVGYGSFNKVKISDKYAELYGMAGSEEEHLALLREILLNGLASGQSMVLEGFSRTLDKNQTFTNRLNTFGTDSQNRTVTGTASTTVRTLNVENKIFVIDYGKTVRYEESKIFSEAELQNTYLKLNVDGAWKKLEETPVAQGIFGSAALGARDGIKYFEYTLQRFMSGPDAFKIGVEPYETDSEGNIVTSGQEPETLEKTVTMMPASNIYYEENFSDSRKVDTAVNAKSDLISDTGIIYSGNWELVTTPAGGSYDENGFYAPGENVTAADGFAGDIDEQAGMATEGDYAYGYDPHYDNKTDFSNKTAWMADSTNGVAKMYFQFKGDGIDIYSRTNTETGLIRFNLYQNQNGTWKLIKMQDVDMLYKMGDLYQVPVVSFSGKNLSKFTYGEYRVEILVGSTKEDENSKKRTLFYLDGIRVYNPAGHSAETEREYAKNGEANADYTEIRDILLDQCTGEAMYGAVYIDSQSVEQQFDPQNPGEQVVSEVAAYEEYGPKHEVYLRSNGSGTFTSIAFDVAYQTGMNLQIGAKATENSGGTGTNAARLTVSVAEKQNQTNYRTTEITLNSTSDMYYGIALPEAADGAVLTVTISNWGMAESDANNFAALTKLKQSFGQTGAAASEYTVDEQTAAVAFRMLNSMMLRSAPSDDAADADVSPKTEETAEEVETTAAEQTGEETETTAAEQTGEETEVNSGQEQAEIGEPSQEVELTEAPDGNGGQEISPPAEKDSTETSQTPEKNDSENVTILGKIKSFLGGLIGRIGNLFRF